MVLNLNGIFGEKFLLAVCDYAENQNVYEITLELDNTRPYFTAIDITDLNDQYAFDIMGMEADGSYQKVADIGDMVWSMPQSMWRAQSSPSIPTASCMWAWTRICLPLNSWHSWTPLAHMKWVLSPIGPTTGQTARATSFLRTEGKCGKLREIKTWR